MITAIVIMNCELGKVHNVAETLTQLDGVAEVYSISGEFDILAICKVSEFQNLATLVTEEMASIDGVTKTTTHMAFQAYSKHDMERVWAETMGQ
jgi:DNA-binding Lrp family transcriptional regulator